ncbi:16S rRNA (uracil(1498)-N(3))-methyltransferase [Roseburia sp. MSJ-14]|uniref:16S rRNA (uracil(1498)-N(3))-methyltransferase n=1 Tax=Roseburia sp. MSJ-14 TaxID=2841514 RepID=UPI001C124F51|nr:16S rRNA (uracil(1498)-N(3))-methyltransferase [Roseburia sp. MSJ-14]MBU5472533.1 16S rRNA (uracil(1498)-N(3))-methyltransferase [Roseburia sp. MSJ-14]
MFQFFVEPEQIREDIVIITGSDVNHIRNVLRMKSGEQVRISDNCGGDYLCEIQEITAEQVALHILETCANTELPVKVTLYQGLPKSDKMELIIQKAVELGVSEIVPVSMKNCVVKLDEKKAKSKQSRWQSIAESAAKQSKRSVIPTVGAVMTFAQAVEQAKNMDVRLVPYEQERGMAYTRASLDSIKKGDEVAIFIGPEGGFAPSEIELVRDDMKLISLGNRILRTETAGLATLAMLIFAIED